MFDLLESYLKSIAAGNAPTKSAIPWFRPRVMSSARENTREKSHKNVAH